MDFITTVKRSKPLMSLLVTGVAIFPSLFMSPKVLGVVFLLFFLSVVWNITSTMGVDILSRLSDDTWEKHKEAKNNNKRFESSIYLIVFPMVIIGIAMILIQIFALMFLM